LGGGGVRRGDFNEMKQSLTVRYENRHRARDGARGIVELLVVVFSRKEISNVWETNANAYL
jgi:hypothetical protein